MHVLYNNRKRDYEFEKDLEKDGKWLGHFILRVSQSGKAATQDLGISLTTPAQLTGQCLFCKVCLFGDRQLSPGILLGNWEVTT